MLKTPYVPTFVYVNMITYYETSQVCLYKYLSVEWFIFNHRVQTTFIESKLVVRDFIAKVREAVVRDFARRLVEVNKIC